MLKKPFFPIYKLACNGKKSQLSLLAIFPFKLSRRLPFPKKLNKRLIYVTKDSYLC